jgi:DNA-binding winged helix-turn-helix (wHTH) protein/Flp pilus assembly protein TadD
MRFAVTEVEVGPFLVDLTTGRILRDGIELGLRPQAFRVFKTLIENRGQYIDHNHMIEQAWDGTVVSRHTVDVTVAELKKALQEFTSWIMHRPKLGYRLDVPKSDDLVRKGWHFWNQRTRQGFEKALESFQAAALEDGSDFRAYEGLAASYLTLATYCMQAPRDLYPLFKDAHRRAASLAGMTPELRSHYGHALHMFERKFDEAEAELLQAEREKPGLSRIYQLLAMLYVCTGRFEDALQAVAKGYKVDPLWPPLPAVEISVRFFARDYEGAVECGRNSIELHPYVHIGRGFYAQALEYSGRVDDALRQYRMGYMMSPGLTWLHVLEAACLYRIGRKSEAAQSIKQIEELRKTEYVDAYCLALAYDVFGARDRAFEELERAKEENSINLSLLAIDPRMDSLRQDIRFERILKEIQGRTSNSPNFFKGSFEKLGELDVRP